MSSGKNNIKGLLPVYLRKILKFYIIQFKQSREKLQITKKNSRRIEALLRNPVQIKLELGSSVNRGLTGWTYVDANMNCDLSLDLTKPLPFPDNSVSEIYSSHLLEHFNYPDLMNLLRECRRILKPYGIFSAAVPNARIYMDAYRDPEAFNPDIYCRYQPAYNYNSKIDYVNYIAYMNGQHQYMFDEDNIVAILKKSSFRKVNLRKFDKRIDILDRRLQSIYVIGEK